MRSISDLRDALQSHTAGLHKHRWNPKVVLAIWNKLLPNRKMTKTSKRRMTRKKGGASYSLDGAPLNYAMIPGSAFTTNPTVAVYDRFPIDPTVNPQVVSDLDVYFSSALSHGCGVENSTLHVPADMGSNQVGGGGHASGHASGKASGHASRKSIRKSKRAVGGNSILNGVGDFGSSIGNHPYLGTAYPNIAQSLTNTWQGKLDVIPSSADPTDHTWKMATETTRNPIPGSQWATHLGESSGLMASWATPATSVPAASVPASAPTSATSTATTGGRSKASRRRSKDIKASRRRSKTSRTKKSRKTRKATKNRK